MKLIIRAGGVMRSGPERELVDDYMKRANGLTDRCGIHSVSEQEIDVKKCKSRSEETRKILSTIAAPSKLIVLDERGKSVTSRQLARSIDDAKLDGVQNFVFAVGAADGFEPADLPTGTIKWSFGQQTWPHKLVRVMAAEQMYRALSILAGTPYHRD